MLIHVVKPGDTVYSIALEYGIPMSQLILDNGLETSSRLAVGQALVVQFPTQTHTVHPGETLASIAAAYQALPLTARWWSWTTRPCSPQHAKVEPLL